MDYLRGFLFCVKLQHAILLACLYCCGASAATDSTYSPASRADQGGAGLFQMSSADGSRQYLGYVGSDGAPSGYGVSVSEDFIHISLEQRFSGVPNISINRKTMQIFYSAVDSENGFMGSFFADTLSGMRPSYYGGDGKDIQGLGIAFDKNRALAAFFFKKRPSKYIYEISRISRKKSSGVWVSSAYSENGQDAGAHCFNTETLAIYSCLFKDGRFSEVSTWRPLIALKK